MGPVIGDVLPLALGIAISPLPIMATTIMLLSPKARGTSVGFLIGWVAGITVMTTLFVLLAALLPSVRPHTPNVLIGAIEMLLGLLLIVLAVRTWRARPRAGESPPVPRWITAIDSLTLWRGLAVGFVYSAFRPKNLLISLAAGVVIGSARLALAPATVVMAIFVALAASTIAAPVVAFFSGAPRVTTGLEGLREWLLRNISTVTATALLFLGVVIVGMGIAEF
ncbi:hypothetical protein GCM10027413_19060 [Conyzicola nivalis]|uniref:Sap-like sulfolipid-1-addressing protein n=1 Tax=Conyzicola nivalis TaxID=1477021 RepID=A0A916SE28_9MICO|nr:GAP family protein [Conyzicola nivalis]GGA95626.1 hypothetical protein GCM10010979_07560 [Conyzicola nivalis]